MDSKLLEEGIKLTTALVSLLASGAIAGGARHLWRWYNNRKALSMQNVARLTSQVYTVMGEILQRTGAMRVLVLRLENGGTKPAVGKPLYSSIVYEDVRDGVQRIGRGWQKQLIDDEYIRMILDVTTKNVTVLQTEKMMPSILKDSYIANGVQHSYVYSIYEGKGQYFYVSIDFDELMVHSHALNDMMRASINEIRNIYKEQYKYA